MEGRKHVRTQRPRSFNVHGPMRKFSPASLLSLSAAAPRAPGSEFEQKWGR